MNTQRKFINQEDFPEWKSMSLDTYWGTLQCYQNTLNEREDPLCFQFHIKDQESQDKNCNQIKFLKIHRKRKGQSLWNSQRTMFLYLWLYTQPNCEAISLNARVRWRHFQIYSLLPKVQENMIHQKYGHPTWQESKGSLKKANRNLKMIAVSRLREQSVRK